MFGEELAILQHDVHRHEVVEILLGMIGLKLAHGAKCIDRHDGQDVLQNMFQSKHSQCVWVDDGNAWSSLLKIHIG